MSPNSSHLRYSQIGFNIGLVVVYTVPLGLFALFRLEITLNREWLNVIFYTAYCINLSRKKPAVSGRLV